LTEEVHLFLHQTKRRVFSSIINASFQQVLMLCAFELKACAGTIIKSISIGPFRASFGLDVLFGQ
jgi:hypothetical protein